MKFSKIVTVAMAVVELTLVANPAPAFSKARARENSGERGDFHKRVGRGYDFPAKDWHKGPYLAANIGFMQMCDDTHTVIRVKFGVCLDLNLGLTLGWDVADWIGPMLQIHYATATDWVGNGGVATGIYPEGTFPTESARQHALDVSLFAKLTLPYFTHARWQWNNFRLNPYLKVGGTGYVMFVHAPTPANGIGAFGGGPAVGAGVEVYVWYGFFFGFDLTENLIFQKSFHKTIAGNVTQLTDGGLRPQFEFMGTFGWHF